MGIAGGGDDFGSYPIRCYVTMTNFITTFRFRLTRSPSLPSLFLGASPGSASFTLFPPGARERKDTNHSHGGRRYHGRILSPLLWLNRILDCICETEFRRSKPMLEVNNIEIVYSDVIRVLKGISFEVPTHAVVALLGSNGAGKSTVLKAVSNTLDLEDGAIEEGSITFEGIRIDRFGPERIVRLGVVHVPEGRGIFDDLTALENLKIGAYTRRDTAGIRADLEAALEYFPPLRHRLLSLAGYLSGGEQQMLAIGRAMMARCKLLMLDEPSLGLAPLFTEDIFRIIGRINREQKASILLVEQNARLALSVASYGYIMESGKIVLDGPSEKLAENEDVKEFYLGITEAGTKKSYRQVKHYKRRKRWLS
jgi:branched-chain amino acid transport system ATP-binding protein